MKKYTLWIFLNDTSVTETVTAETHTIENGVFIFWVRNNNGEWCQTSIYPASCTAITRIQEAEGYAMVKSNDTNVKTNPTLDIEALINNGLTKVEAVPEIPTMKAKTKSKK